MTDEPRISDAECHATLAYFENVHRSDGLETMRQALAAFLAARVPDAPFPPDVLYHPDFDAGFNACRDIVLKGRE